MRKGSLQVVQNWAISRRICTLPILNQPEVGSRRNMPPEPLPHVQKSLDLITLRRSYQTGAYDPRALLLSLAAGIRAQPDRSVWIHICSDEQIRAQLSRSEARRAEG